jgi:hypothetical protein
MPPTSAPYGRPPEAAQNLNPRRVRARPFGNPRKVWFQFWFQAWFNGHA